MAADVNRADGSVISFSRFSSSNWQSDLDITSKLLTMETGFQYQSGNLIEDYDPSGKLIMVTNLKGRTQYLSYNLDNTLSLVEDDVGNTINFVYSGANLQSIQTSDGRSWVYGYDATNNLTTVTNPDNTILTYHYENSSYPNFLTGITDERNILSEHFTYDYKGRATRSYKGDFNSDIAGVSIQYVNVGYGRRKVTGSHGGESFYTWESKNGMPVITDIAGSGCANCGNKGNQSYVYDSSNNVTSRTIEGSISNYGDYDASGNYGYKEIAVGTTEQRRIDYIYDPRFYNKVTSKTEPSVFTGSNKVTTYTYDNFANVTQITINGFTPTGTPVSRTTRLTYNGPLNQLSQIDGPRTDVADITTIDYYANDAGQGNNRARVQRITTSGLITRDNIQYTATGKVTSEQRPNGVSLSYQYYPGNDRLQTLTQAGSSISTTTQWTYLASGEVETITRNAGTPASTTLTFGYDAARRLTSITDNNGNRRVYTLDTEGNRINEETYDNANQLKQAITQTFDLYNTLDTNSQANEFADYNYLANGTLDTTTDGNNVTTDYSYDALQRLTATTQDLGGSNPATQNTTSTYGYDAQDNLTLVTDPINGNTTYAYDDLGNLLQQTSPDTGTTRFTYDAAGNLLTRIDAKGQTFTYQYDALNRLQLLDAPGTTDDVSYTYDACPSGTGRLCSITKDSIVNTYSYNAFGNITQHQGIQYTYNYPGRVKTITYPSGNRVTYYYDALGQVSQVDSSINGTVQTIASNIRYAPFGPITALTYGNGAQLTQTFDTAYRMTNQSIPGIFERNYALYDSNGNLKAIDDLINNSSDIFNFDSLNRIMDATGAYGMQSFDYDKNGNRTGLTDNAVSTTNSYQPLSNRLTQVGSNAITLDANGNTLNDGKYSYGFDSHNRLISVDTDLAIYQYNGLGQRIGKQTGTAGPDYAVLAAQAQAEADLLNQQATTAQQQATESTTQAIQQETEAASLTQQAQQYRSDASNLQTQISELTTQQTQQRQLAAQLQASADDYRSRVVEPPTNFIQRILNPIYNWVADYFQGQANNATVNADAIGQQMATLQTQIEPLNTQAVQLEQSATALLTQASTLRSQASSQQAQSDNLLQQANAAQTQANEYTQLAQNPQNTTANYQYRYNLTGQLLVETKAEITDSEYIYLNGQPLAVIRQGNVYYIHTDNLGTPRAVSNANQTTVWRWNSDAFGATAANEDVDGDGTNFVMNLRFPGQYFDSETGLHYNYYRDYDPSTGRYITADPLGMVPDPTETLSDLNHLYVYAKNNPVNLADPYGLLPGMPWPEFGPVCGSGASTGMIPDGIYKKACENHDRCYSTCGKTKQQCDEALVMDGAPIYALVLILSSQAQEAYDNAQSAAGCNDCDK